jgi:hypothetical protein
MYQDWPIAQTFVDVQRQQQKRTRHEERRPQISKASDLLGPGLAPTAVMLVDWNAPETLFNGIFYSDPGSLNSPDGTLAWMGQTYMNSDGYGYQQVVRYSAVFPETDALIGYIRRITPTYGTVGYSGWTQNLYGDDPPVFPSLLNGWANSGGIDQDVSWVYRGGMVHIQGVVKDGVLGDAAFNLPVGRRPAAVLPIATIASGPVLGRIRIDSAGDVIPVSGSNVWFSVQASFRPEVV